MTDSRINRKIGEYQELVDGLVEDVEDELKDLEDEKNYMKDASSNKYKEMACRIKRLQKFLDGISEVDLMKYLIK